MAGGLPPTRLPGARGALGREHPDRLGRGGSPLRDGGRSDLDPGRRRAGARRDLLGGDSRRAGRWTGRARRFRSADLAGRGDGRPAGGAAGDHPGADRRSGRSPDPERFPAADLARGGRVGTADGDRRGEGGGRRVVDQDPRPRRRHRDPEKQKDTVTVRTGEETTMSLRSTSLTIAFLVVATLFLLGAGPPPPKRPAPPAPPGGVDHVFFFSSRES